MTTAKRDGVCEFGMVPFPIFPERGFVCGRRARLAGAAGHVGRPGPRPRLGAAGDGRRQGRIVAGVGVPCKRPPKRGTGRAEARSHQAIDSSSSLISAVKNTAGEKKTNKRGAEPKEEEEKKSARRLPRTLESGWSAGGAHLPLPVPPPPHTVHSSP